MIEVTLTDHMGDDLMVVNTAKVSFAKASEWVPIMYGDSEGQVTIGKSLSGRDRGLIKFLSRGMTTEDFASFVDEVEETGWLAWDVDSAMWRPKLLELLRQWRQTPTHFSPFAHPQAQFRIKAPIFLARQLQKHQVGFSWNEVSRRYVQTEPEYYTPETWRAAADNVKQGSSERSVANAHLVEREYELALRYADSVYKTLLRDGVCAEQARMVLPQSMMTEWIWTGSLYGWSRVCNLRSDSHAQRENAEVIKPIADAMAKLFPVSWDALTNA